jgi:hypothetical protein
LLGSIKRPQGRDRAQPRWQQIAEPLGISKQAVHQKLLILVTVGRGGKKTVSKVAGQFLARAIAAVNGQQVVSEPKPIEVPFPSPLKRGIFQQSRVSPLTLRPVGFSVVS